MDVPETRYAKSGDLRIAYQVVGSGELDLVFIQGFVSNLDLCWEEPGWAYFLFFNRGPVGKPQLAFSSA